MSFSVCPLVFECLPIELNKFFIPMFYFGKDKSR